jgi:small subunit ribosomal protein S5
LAKSLGTSNPINVVHATVAALKSLREPAKIAELRGLELEEFMPKKMYDNLKAGA